MSHPMMLSGLFQALRRRWVTYRIRRQLLNWNEVADHYFNGRPITLLQFRSGMILHSTVYDAPVPTFLEVINDGCYRRFNKRPLKGTILDIGANIGVVTLDWLRRYPDVEIHAYEPNPSTYETFRLNIEVNGLSKRVRTYPEAVGSRCGTLSFWSNVPSVSANSYSPPCPGAVQIEVPMIDLETAMRRVEKQPISLVKIDAEGAEVEILENTPTGVLRQAEQYVLEYHLPFHRDADKRCQDVLKRVGFRCRQTVLGADHGLIYAWRID